MKKHYLFLLIITFACLTIIFCASTGNTIKIDGITLEEAIEQSSKEIAQKLPAGTRVAIAAFDSEDMNLSGYIIDELTGSLTGGSLEVTDRRNLAVVYKELDFQMAGDVSDETAASIGKFLGAQYVVTGQFLKVGKNYRYRVSSIKVETAVQVSSTRLDVQNSHNLQNMITDLKKNKITAPSLYSRPASPPGTAGAFIDRGIIFAVRGDWELAIADFTEAIKLDGNIMAAWVFRARAYSASVSHILSIKEDFSGFSSFVEKGRNITEEQKIGHNNAIADYNQALRLNPNDPNAYIGRGHVFSFQTDDAKALADYNRAINVDPNCASAYICRGNVYYRQGNYDRAIEDHTQAIRLDPNNDSAYTNRGDCYAHKNNYDKAIADLNNAIRLNQNNDRAKNNLDLARRKRGW